jgi:uncharacterized protein (DUF736 family)
LKRWIPRPPPATRRIGKISPARQAGLLAAATLQIFPPAGSSTVFRPHWVQSGSYAVSEREPSQEPFLRTQTSEKETTMAITLGTFSKQENGTFTGTLRTLNVSAAISIVPADKHSDNAPDYRVYAGQRYEVGAGWSQVAKSSGETYENLKIAAPEFGPNWVRCRLVKLEHPSDGGATHFALWEPRDR